jgi:hypothetical protein
LGRYVLNKDPTKINKENKRPGTEAIIQAPKQAHHKNIATCARSMGGCTTCTTSRIVVGMRKKERRNLTSGQPRKAPRNPVP